MIGRRARDAGIDTKAGNLRNGGTVDKAAAMANHARPARPSLTIADTTT